MSNILIITNDYIGAQMAGPAIRAWEMARVLSGEHSVMLASLQQPSAASDAFTVTQINKHSVHHCSNWAEIIIVHPTILWFLPMLKSVEKPLIIDVYNVWPIEALEANKSLSLTERVTAHQFSLEILGDLLTRGDYFLCAGERQKDYWLGMLHYAGRVEPQLYANDPLAESLLGIVPNGIPHKAPCHRKNVLKGACEGIRATDSLLIWGGSVCNWFDPLTLIRAMALLRENRSDIKLFFMGLKAPNDQVAAYIWSEADKAVALSKELGVYRSSVFFNQNWIPYEDRENYLLEADLGITLHYNNLETRYAFRTRVLDYLWANLPVITSEGDTMSALVETHNLGRVVPYQNAEEVARTIVGLLDSPNDYLQCQKNIDSIKAELTWENAMQPLLAYCRYPGTRNRQRK